MYDCSTYGNIERRLVINGEGGVIERRVVGEYPLGTRFLRVCETTITATGETVAEVVEYNPRAEEGRDPYGAGAIIPLDLLTKVAVDLRVIAKEHA